MKSIHDFIKWRRENKASHPLDLGVPRRLKHGNLFPRYNDPHAELCHGIGCVSDTVAKTMFNVGCTRGCHDGEYFKTLLTPVMVPIFGPRPNLCHDDSVSYSNHCIMDFMYDLCWKQNPFVQRDIESKMIKNCWNLQNRDVYDYDLVNRMWLHVLCTAKKYTVTESIVLRGLLCHICRAKADHVADALFMVILELEKEHPRSWIGEDFYNAWHEMDAYTKLPFLLAFAHEDIDRLHRILRRLCYFAPVVNFKWVLLDPSLVVPPNVFDRIQSPVFARAVYLAATDRQLVPSWVVSKFAKQGIYPQQTCAEQRYIEAATKAYALFCEKNNVHAEYEIK